MKTDVLIVGGGLAGCATAYYLAREGVDVTLIERGDLGARASGSNAGSIHVQIPHHEFLTLGEDWARTFAPTLPMMVDSVRLWTGLGAEIGVDLGVSITGGLLVAETAEQMRAVEAKAAIERAHGVTIDILARDELRSLAPYVSNRMIGAAWCADEGKANPLIATGALSGAARQHGAVVRTRTELVALDGNRGAYRAETSRGTIEAARVVNAAGADAGRVGAMLGLDLPIEGFPLQVSVTEPAAPVIPHLVYSAAGKLTLKQMANGTCMIGGGWPSTVRADGRLAVNPHSLTANLATATAVVPALKPVRIARTWPAMVNGTADWKPLIGEVPGRRGFFLTLFPWMGFTAGPIAALVTAELILGRKQSVDLAAVSALAD